MEPGKKEKRKCLLIYILLQLNSFSIRIEKIYIPPVSPWSTNHVVPVQEKCLFLTKKKKRKKRKSHSLNPYRHLNSIIAFILYNPLRSEKMALDDLEPAVTCLDCKWHTSLLHTELITQPHPPIKVSPFCAPMNRAPEVFGELHWCLHLKMGNLRLRKSKFSLQPAGFPLWTLWVQHPSF